MLSNKAFGESRLAKPVGSLSGLSLYLQLLSHGAVPTSYLLPVAKSGVHVTVGCRCQTDWCKFVVEL